MASFKEWLFDRLMEDDVIDDSWDIDELTVTDLTQCTELEISDIENYRADFEEYCLSRQEEPDWDLED